MGTLMRITIWLIASGFLAGTSMSSISSAAAILDQSNTGPSSDVYSDINKGSYPEVGETFTAGRSGLLDSVNLAIYEGQLYEGSTPSGYYNSGAEVNIRNASGSVLGTATLAASAIPDDNLRSNNSPLDVAVSFSSSNISLVAGNTYSVGVIATTLAPSGDGGNGLELSATGNTYAGGAPYIAYNANTSFNPSPFFADSNDLEFQTYEKTPVSGGGGGGPEPSTWALMVVGVFGVGIALRRREAMVERVEGPVQARDGLLGCMRGL